jgi:hypothetical protein
MGGFFYYPWYRFLEWRYGVARTAAAVASKVAVDTFLFLPLVEMPAFFLFTAAIEREDPVQRFQHNFDESARAGVAFKLPVALVNFIFVPPALRVPVLDAADLFWTSIMSYLGHREE